MLTGIVIKQTLRRSSFPEKEMLIVDNRQQQVAMEASNMATNSYSQLHCIASLCSPYFCKLKIFYICSAYTEHAGTSKLGKVLKVRGHVCGKNQVNDDSTQSQVG